MQDGPAKRTSIWLPWTQLRILLAGSRMRLSKKWNKLDIQGPSLLPSTTEYGRWAGIEDNKNFGLIPTTTILTSRSRIIRTMCFYGGTLNLTLNKYSEKWISWSSYMDGISNFWIKYCCKATNQIFFPRSTLVHSSVNTCIINQWVSLKKKNRS